jgi:putative transcriptional regulator
MVLLNTIVVIYHKSITMQVLFIIIIGVYRMIVNHLPTLLAERRLKVADAVRATGVSKTTLHKIYNDQSSRIDFDTIDKLCEYLDVEVGDIFEYIKDDKEENTQK